MKNISEEFDMPIESKRKKLSDIRKIFSIWFIRSSYFENSALDRIFVQRN